MSRKRKPLPATPVETVIESLTHEGRGVAHLEGKAVFVDGALPGERVMFRYLKRKRRYDEGEVVEVLEPSVDRVEARCPHFNICGGCSLQHMEGGAQIRAKQQVLLDDFQHLGGVEPEEVLPPLGGPLWGYRRKARLGVRYVIKKGRLLVGFREKRSPYLAELTRCEVLHPSVGERIEALAALIDGLALRDRIAQIEVAVGDATTALVFRNLEPLGDADLAALRAFGAAHAVQVWLQPGGLETAAPLDHDAAPLAYRLDDYDVELRFRPTDFTQVNAAINRKMIPLALELLDLQPGDRVLDLFCGLGNFTLPLARRVAEVHGVEGDAELVARAQANAEHNGIVNAHFHVADLFQAHATPAWLAGRFDKIVVDPPRAGALEVLPRLAKLGARRLVYVSCNPATLARDAGELVRSHGFRLRKAGVMDMFPHTAHVESIALFERD